MIKFRASEAGKLMIGGTKGLTENEKRKYDDYRTREKLTPNQDEVLEKLRKKEKAPFKFGETSMTLIRENWLYKNYGVKKVFVTDQTQKGNLCEEDSCQLLTEIYPEFGFRVKNKKTFENEFFTGTPDLLPPRTDVVEDIKTCYDIFTFDKKGIDSISETVYKIQALVYMALTGRKTFYLRYCLVNTPVVFVDREVNRMFNKFNREETDEFRKIEAQIRANHNYDHIPATERVKSIKMDWDQDLYDKLVSRVKLARKEFDKCKL